MIDWVEVIGVVAMVLAVTGVVCNNHRWIVCFPIFLVSNTLSAWGHWQVDYQAMVVRDLVFLALAVHGWVAWRKREDLINVFSERGPGILEAGSKAVPDYPWFDPDKNPPHDGQRTLALVKSGTLYFATYEPGTYGKGFEWQDCDQEDHYIKGVIGWIPGPPARLKH